MHRKKSAAIHAALVYATASYGTVAMAVPPVDSSTSSPSTPGEELTGRLRVKIDDAIEDAPLIATWITARNSHMVEELASLDGRERWLVVEIGGSTYDYRVSVVAMQDGELLASTAAKRCVCTNEELLVLLDGEITAAAAALHEPAVEQPGPDTTESRAMSATSGALEAVPTRGRHLRLGPLGCIGIGAAALGAGMMAGGILLALRNDQVRGDPGDVMSRSTHGAGVGLAVAGGVMLAGGVAAIVIDVRRSRRGMITIAPMGTRTHASVTLTWRI